ncbi:PGPGW domain-containing protein [Kitasatospora sp. NPDC049285]|uniref:PGPGW domain-containing protein n=1 Tax=Kitasatospora sp. NPDC049285 TaxID=3157096 RepID=UPI0034323129
MSEQQWTQTREGAATSHPLVRVAFGVGGAVLIVAGVALLVLPGPGMLLLLAGMILFSRAVPAVARYVEPLRVRAMRGAEAGVSSPWRIAGTVLAGLALIGAGAAWALVPALPLAGWGTGLGLAVSGVILLALIGWSYRRVRAARAAQSAA